MNLDDFLNNKLKKDTVDIIIAFANGDILDDHNYHDYYVIDCVYKNKEAYITIVSKNEKEYIM